MYAAGMREPDGGVRVAVFSLSMNTARGAMIRMSMPATANVAMRTTDDDFEGTPRQADGARRYRARHAQVAAGWRSEGRAHCRFSSDSAASGRAKQCAR